MGIYNRTMARMERPDPNEPTGLIMVVALLVVAVPWVLDHPWQTVLGLLAIAGVVAAVRAAWQGARSRPTTAVKVALAAALAGAGVVGVVRLLDGDALAGVVWGDVAFAVGSGAALVVSFWALGQAIRVGRRDGWSRGAHRQKLAAAELANVERANAPTPPPRHPLVIEVSTRFSERDLTSLTSWVGQHLRTGERVEFAAAAATMKPPLHDLVTLTNQRLLAFSTPRAKDGASPTVDLPLVEVSEVRARRRSHGVGTIEAVLVDGTQVPLGLMSEIVDLDRLAVLLGRQKSAAVVGSVDHDRAAGRSSVQLGKPRR